MASVTDKCPRCLKKEFHFATKIDPEKPIPPPMAMMGGSNLDIMLLEDEVPEQGKFYIFFRCQDPMCLLSHFREMVMIGYFQQQQQQRHEELEKARLQAAMKSKQRQPSRKANKRLKAKMKAKAKESSDR